MSQLSLKSTLIIICFFSNTVFSQIFMPNFEVESFEEFQNKKKELFQKMLFSDYSGHYALFGAGKFGNGKKTIRKFTLDFQPEDYKIIRLI